jgi:benzoate/toluate 1,2-dioxygenase beta subunit/2,4,5-trichlorophenoxyacetic acid oxygenase 2
MSTMNRMEATFIAQEHLAREGLLLDRLDWDGWLALYREDAVYWVPGWIDEDTLTTDVRRQVSLVWHTRRDELLDRVVRIRSRKSVTAMPLPRTTHSTSNMLVESCEPGRIVGAASFLVHEHHPRIRRSDVLFGRYEFEITQDDDGQAWRYARKKTILQNDLIPTLVDFYNL